MLRVPLIWHMRDILRPGPSRRLVQVMGNGASRIVCMSRATAAQFEGSRARRRVRVITDGIDIRRFSAPADPAWRGRLGASDGDVVVALIGQIARWKGQDVFIEAAGELLRRGARARFAIVGQVLFSERESAYDREIRALAATAGVSEALTWTGWTDDVPAVVAALDVLVHASREPEPFGRVIVEGLAAGKPVVTTVIGSGPELVPPTAGRLVEPGNPRALADALEPLITDEDERRRCGKAALEAAQNFDIARVAREVMAVYCELVPCA
jgi:glycosyltransferase involved in cell wall biosynthesis